MTAVARARRHTPEGKAVQTAQRARNAAYRAAYDAEYRTRPYVREADRQRELRRYTRPEVRERAAATAQAWYEANKHRPKYRALRSAALRRRYDRELAAVSHQVSDRDIARLLRYPCTYCGAKATVADHVVPLARGGLHRIGNLTPACARCNHSKGSRLVIEWRRRLMEFQHAAA